MTFSLALCRATRFVTQISTSNQTFWAKQICDILYTAKMCDVDSGQEPKMCLFSFTLDIYANTSIFYLGKPYLSCFYLLSAYLSK